MRVAVAGGHQLACVAAVVEARLVAEVEVNQVTLAHLGAAAEPAAVHGAAAHSAEKDVAAGRRHYQFAAALTLLGAAAVTAAVH